jgi:hypothetical protein
VLSLFGVTHCYSYSQIKSVIIVIPPGEYPINRVSNPELTSYLLRYQGNSRQCICNTILLISSAFHIYVYIYTQNSLVNAILRRYWLNTALSMFHIESVSGRCGQILGTNST